MGLPWWPSGKVSACQYRRYKRCSSIPGSGRSPGRGNGNPLHYSCLENHTDRGAWWATIQGVSKSQTQLSEHNTENKILFYIYVNILKRIYYFQMLNVKFCRCSLGQVY